MHTWTRLLALEQQRAVPINAACGSNQRLKAAAMGSSASVFLKSFCCSILSENGSTHAHLDEVFSTGEGQKSLV